MVKKIKSKKISKILGKPKTKGIKGLDQIKAISSMAQGQTLVTKGKEGFMDTEMQKEKVDFLEGYSL